MPGAVGATGLYVLIPAHVASAMFLWGAASLAILDVNVFAYNEKLQSQKQEEEELVKKMAID